jgi:hypothetical protein
MSKRRATISLQTVEPKKTRMTRSTARTASTLQPEEAKNARTARRMARAARTLQPVEAKKTKTAKTTKTTKTAMTASTLQKVEAKKARSASKLINARGTSPTAVFQAEENMIGVKVHYNKKRGSNRMQKNPRIASLPDGLYTYVIDDNFNLICSPVEMFEAGSKHIQLAKNVSRAYAAGEFSKNGKKITYNLQSGTFMTLNRTGRINKTSTASRFRTAARAAMQRDVISGVFRNLGASEVTFTSEALLSEFGNWGKQPVKNFLSMITMNANIVLPGIKKYGFTVTDPSSAREMPLPQAVFNNYVKLIKSGASPNNAYNKSFGKYQTNILNLNSKISILRREIRVPGRRPLPVRRGPKYGPTAKRLAGLGNNATDDQIKAKLTQMATKNLKNYEEKLNKLLGKKP